jgi:hypothetical protein
MTYRLRVVSRLSVAAGSNTSKRGRWFIRDLSQVSSLTWFAIAAAAGLLLVLAQSMLG